MNEKKGNVKGVLICPRCGVGIDLSCTYINTETLSEEIQPGEYRRPRCLCGYGFSYDEVKKAVEQRSKLNDINTAP